MSNSSGGSSSGLGGLLSNQVTQAAKRSTATLAVATPSTPSTNADPTLTAPGGSLLPPLPQGRNHAHHTPGHRGLLAGWVHDVAGWF